MSKPSTRTPLHVLVTLSKDQLIARVQVLEATLFQPEPESLASAICDAASARPSPKEFAVLALLLSRAGKPVTYQSIALACVTRLNKDSFEIEWDNSAKVYISRLRKKLPFPINSIRGIGYTISLATLKQLESLHGISLRTHQVHPDHPGHGGSVGAALPAEVTR